MLRLTTLTILIAVAVVTTLSLSGFSSVSGQTSDSGESVRVIARLLDDGRVEFGLRTPTGDQFPRARFFPTTITHENWLVSSSLALPDGTAVRIIARRAGETRLEFGVRLDDPREEFLPRARFFPRTATLDRWLISTAVELPAPDEPELVAPEPAPPTEPEASDEAEVPTVEVLLSGHRAGLVVERGVIGDRQAPAMIVEYGDPF